MSSISRTPAAPPPSLNEQGPWGAGSGGGGGNSGGSGGSGGPRNPWDLPPASPRPRKSASPQLQELLDRIGRTRFAGGLPGGNQVNWVKWGLIAFAGLWVLFTSFHRIEPQERGVVTRFGRYSHTLDPGISLTFPAPIDRVQVVDVQNIRTIDIPSGTGEKLVLTGDQNLIDLDYSVRWNIKAPEQYLFQLEDPDDSIAALAESAMRAVVANVSLNDALGPGRVAIETEVQQRMQKLLDAYNAGVRIQGIAIKNAGPPEAVNNAFKDVSAAQQDAQASINQANTYAQTVLARAQGEAAQFDRVYAQYKLAPDVTRRRMYYETMEDVLSRTNKTVVEPGVTAYLPLPGVNGQTPAPAQQATQPRQGDQ